MRNPKNKCLRHFLYLFNKIIHEKNVVNSVEKTEFDLSRRDFISKTAKGALGVSISLSLPYLASSCGEHSQDGKKYLDVAILGGGIAGLNCANYLSKSTLHFNIFESDNRLGGRILTHYNDSFDIGVYPEFGGDFIDSGHEEMLNLAKEFNLELIDLLEEQSQKKLIKDIYYFDDRKISEKEIISEFNKIVDKIIADKQSIGEDYDTPNAILLDNTPLSDYFNSLNCAQWLKDILSAAYVAEFGLACSEQSSLNFLDMIDTDTSSGFKIFGESDERYRIKEGNSKIIEGLISKIGKDKIKTGFEVVEIQEKENGLYKVLFKNGEFIISKVIVCTIPFTILRKIKLNLKNISDEKKKCIDELGYGLNTKLILSYQESPWSNEINNAMGYLFHKEIINGWDSSYNKIQDDNRSAYVCYFGGDFSKSLHDESLKHPMAPLSHVWKTALPSDRVEYFVNILDNIFNNSKSKFTDKHIFVNWIDYPFSKGSYSCYKVGQWTTLSGLEIAPIGNILFAGEHCSEMYQGYMNGAAETGRIAAETIMEKIVLD